MNLSQRDGGLPPDTVVQDEDTILADSERLIARYHDGAPDAMVQIALAPCSPFTVTRSLMTATAALAERTSVRLHTHLAETADEVAFCLAKFGCRPLDYLEQAGWLTDRTWLAHGVHFDAGEIGRLAKAGTCVSHCACSNQILASGTCRVCEMEQAGMRVGLGVDGSASNNASNMMQEVRAAYRNRAAGTTSKLSTFKDGARILRAILALIQHERPLQVFSLMAVGLAVAGTSLGMPVLAEYLQTGLVPRLPTALLSTGFVLLSSLSLICGLILDAISRSRKENKRLAYLAIPAPVACE